MGTAALYRISKVFPAQRPSVLSNALNLRWRNNYVRQPENGIVHDLPILPTVCRCIGLLLRMNTLRHTHTYTLSRTPLDKGSARRRDLYLSTHNTHKKEISMSPAGFEPANPAKLAAAYLRLRPHGHWDRPTISYLRMPKLLVSMQNI
jgi:hypothetical protein